MQEDPHRDFSEMLRDLRRAHGRRRRSSRKSRPLSLAEVERRRTVRWTVAVLLGVGLAVAVGLLIPA
jgi:hypothetical protein